MVVTKILVAIDFSRTSECVLDFARTLADALSASLHLLHVIGDPLASSATIELERQDACRRLEALLDASDRDRRHATVTCEVGTPAHEITRYAAGNAIDLIVMGTHRHGPTYRMATGSIAEGVLGMAPCAVLAVKADEQGSCDAMFDPPAVTVFDAQRPA